MSDALSTTELPPGVHPLDPSMPTGGTDVFGTAAPVPADVAGDKFTTGRKPFGTSNRDALGIFQRASHDWAGRVVVLNTSQGGTALVAGRQPGRTSITIWVPTLLPDGSTPLGVVLAATEDEVQAGLNAGIVLNPGDSLTIETEAPVYAGLIGANTAGACQYVVCFNPSDSIGF